MASKVSEIYHELNGISKQILGELLADFFERKLSSDALVKGYVGVSPPALMTKYSGDSTASQVDFDLGLKELENFGLAKTGQVVPYDNPPGLAVFICATVSKREYVYLTEIGYKAVQRAEYLKRRDSAMPRIHISGGHFPAIITLTQHSHGSINDRRDRLAGSALGGRMKIGGDERINRPRNSIYHVLEGQNGLLTDEGLTIAEAYEKGRMDFCFLFDPAIGHLIRSRPIPCRARPVHTNGRIVWNGVSAVKHGCFRHGDDELVLIGNVQGVDTIDEFVPARLRIERYDRFDDVFAGPMYLSACNGGAKAVFAYWLGREGILDVFGTYSQVPDHLPNNMIQRCPEIMNCVTDDQRELWWNGYLGFQYGRGAVAIFHSNEDKFVRLLSQVGVNFPAEIVDVIFGPFGLQSRSARDFIESCHSKPSPFMA